MNINIQNLDSTIEHWASIDGYLNYQVSWWGRVVNTKTGRILKAGRSSNSYLTVILCKEGKRTAYSVHVLVAREWVPNPDNKRCVDHADGDRFNNHHENLRYATQSENCRNRKNTWIVPVLTRVFVLIRNRGSGVHKSTCQGSTYTWEHSASNEKQGKPTTQPLWSILEFSQS